MARRASRTRRAELWGDVRVRFPLRQSGDANAYRGHGRDDSLDKHALCKMILTLRQNAHETPANRNQSAPMNGNTWPASPADGGINPLDAGRVHQTDQFAKVQTGVL